MAPCHRAPWSVNVGVRRQIEQPQVSKIFIPTFVYPNLLLLNFIICFDAKLCMFLDIFTAGPCVLYRVNKFN